MPSIPSVLMPAVLQQLPVQKFTSMTSSYSLMTLVQVMQLAYGKHPTSCWMFCDSWWAIQCSSWYVQDWVSPLHWPVTCHWLLFSVQSYHSYSTALWWSTMASIPVWNRLRICGSCTPGCTEQGANGDPPQDYLEGCLIWCQVLIQDVHWCFCCLDKCSCITYSSMFQLYLCHLQTTGSGSYVRSLNIMWSLYTTRSAISNLICILGHSGIGQWTCCKTLFLHHTSFGMHSSCTNTMAHNTSVSLTSCGPPIVGGGFKYAYISFCCCHSLIILLYLDYQPSLPKFNGAHGAPLVFILYADKTHILTAGSVKAYPIIACITNLPVDIRNGKNCIGSGRLVGWFPIVCIFS